MYTPAQAPCVVIGGRCGEQPLSAHAFEGKAVRVGAPCVRRRTSKEACALETGSRLDVQPLALPVSCSDPRTLAVRSHLGVCGTCVCSWCGGLGGGGLVAHERGRRSLRGSARGDGFAWVGGFCMLASLSLQRFSPCLRSRSHKTRHDAKLKLQDQGMW